MRDQIPRDFGDSHTVGWSWKKRAVFAFGVTMIPVAIVALFIFGIGTQSNASTEPVTVKWDGTICARIYWDDREPELFPCTAPFQEEK